MSGSNGAVAADQGGRPATPADVRVAGVEDMLSAYNEIAAEEGGEPAEAPAPKPAEPKPADPKPAAKGKKTAQDYAAERIAARADKLAAREAELSTKLAELDAKLTEVDATSPAKLKALVESGRADDLAVTLGYKSWEELNGHFARLYASPEYKRIRELEQKTAERDKADKDREARESEQRRGLEYQETVKAAIVEVGATLKGSDNELLAAMAEHDPNFATEVTRRILAAGSDEDIEGIALQVAQGAEGFYRTMHKIFGDRPASTDETAQAGTPTRPGSKQAAKPQKHVSRQSATEAANPLPKQMTDAEWKAYATDEYAKAVRADEEERKRERAG